MAFDFEEQLQKSKDEINKYVSELVNEANGDYDFVVKFLKKQYQMSLGTDDAARTKFFEDVADKLEERIGRIPYDYETLTAREKDAMNRKLQYAEMQDRQQYAQEYEFAAQQKFAKEQEQQTNVETSSKRGLLGSGIQQKSLHGLHWPVN